MRLSQLMMKENYHAFMADTFKAAVPNLKVIYSEVTRDYSELDKYKVKSKVDYFLSNLLISYF